ncbi:MAG TPA: hypothetical protein VGG33_03365 [Polyangia bacterium]
MTQKPPQPALACSDVVERLIGGERPSSDPALSEHVGSCLPCFRTAGDLRGLPTLRRQLQEAEGELPDPGAAFWASFPNQVAIAWEQQQDAAAAPSTVTSASTVTPGPVVRAPARAGRREWIARAIDWLRLPVPAAGAGALAAVALVGVALQGEPTRETANPMVGGAEVATAGVESPSESFATSSRESVAAADEALRELDVNGLQKLQAELERSLAEGVRARPLAEGDESMSTGTTDPAALSEDLDELNEAGLAVLAENLGESI